jgi:8-oxo-dGTP diphosphatase
MYQYTVGFAFTDRSEVLLIHKLKGPAAVRGRLNGIGGKVEPGETFLECVVREFEEETGLQIPGDRWTLKVVLSGSDWKVHFYSTRISTEEAEAASTMEVEEVGLYHAHEVLWKGNVVPNLRWLIPIMQAEELVFPIWMEERSPT